MTETGKLTNEEMLASSQVTGIPLIYIAKLDAFGMLDRRHVLCPIIAQEYAQLKERYGYDREYLSKQIASHHNVSESLVIESLRKFKSKFEK